jgi:hypothetical protein
VLRPLPLALALPVLVLALAGCASTATPVSTPTGDATGAPATQGRLPSCDAVGLAASALVSGLPFDEAASNPSATEAYEQRVCVFGAADGRIGITIAAIPFLDTELQAYGASLNALADARLAEHGGVLQTLVIDDAADGHLDSALYLFDLEYSITIQESGTAMLSQLTVPAAADAAFAVRALIG